MENLALNKLLKENFEEYVKTHKLPHHVISGCYKMIKCRTAELGGSVYECPNKDYRKIIYNSCKHRSCPSCNLINIENWINRIKANLLPANYYHVIFTIPEELNELFLINRKELTNIIFKTSFESINKMMKNEYNIVPGVISTLHTWSRTLSFHPHIHMLITAGGMELESGDWKDSKKKWLLNIKGLSIIFRGKLLDEIHKLVYNENLILEKGYNRYRTHGKLKELRKKNWNVFISEEYDYAHGVAVYLGRYVRGGPISNRRLISYNKEEVKFVYSDLKDGKRKLMNLEMKEFMKRYLFHIPDRRQYTVRYYGLFSNFKSERLKELRKKMDLAPVEEFKPLKAKEFLETRKLGESYCICPYCKSEMNLIGRYNRERLSKIIEIENYLKKDENYRKRVA